MLRYVSLLLAAAAGLAVAPSAHATRYFYTIENVGNGMCVDVPGFTQSNTQVQQYPCNYGNNQYFEFAASGVPGYVELVASHSGKCLEFPGWSTNNHTKLQHYTCNGGDNQLWQVKYLNGREFVLVNKYSGKCLDVAGGTHSAGFHLQQYSCHHGSNQRFRTGWIGKSVSH